MGIFDQWTKEEILLLGNCDSFKKSDNNLLISVRCTFWHYGSSFDFLFGTSCVHIGHVKKEALY